MKLHTDKEVLNCLILADRRTSMKAINCLLPEMFDKQGEWLFKTITAMYEISDFDYYMLGMEMKKRYPQKFVNIMDYVNSVSNELGNFHNLEYYVLLKNEIYFIQEFDYLIEKLISQNSTYTEVTPVLKEIRDYNEKNKGQFDNVLKVSEWLLSTKPYLSINKDIKSLSERLTGQILKIRKVYGNT